jgi:hypothetical protein
LVERSAFVLEMTLDCAVFCEVAAERFPDVMTDRDTALESTSESRDEIERTILDVNALWATFCEDALDSALEMPAENVAAVEPAALATVPAEVAALVAPLAATPALVATEVPLLTFVAAEVAAEVADEALPLAAAALVATASKSQLAAVSVGE